MFTKPANWNQLTPEQKKALRLDNWEKAEGLQFVSPQAEKNYRERAHRLRLAYELKHPDRPIADFSMGGEYALRRAGLNANDMLYHHEKLAAPVLKFNEEFQPDTAVGGAGYPGPVFDTLDFKTYIWSGQKLGDQHVIQMVEGEYMNPDEYDMFIHDPTGFMLKIYLGRMFGALAPFSTWDDLIRVTEIVDVGRFAMPFGMPAMQEALKKLMKAGDQTMAYMGSVGAIYGALPGMGFPSMGSAFVKAPFDFVGDTLRGTKGIISDMFRRPKDVLAACDTLVPLLVKQIIQTCDMMGAPCAMYPLHKGADTFMSQAQFEKFYWPTLKAVMMGLWEEGIMSYMFAEGGHNTRLETYAQLPVGSSGWIFDQTDMKKAKEYLEGRALIAGNVPASVMQTGSPEKVKEVCGSLVDLFRGSAGYIMGLGCGIETSTDEKVRLFLDAVKH